MTKNKDNPKPPERLELTAQMEINAVAAGGDGQPALPRFSMVAYTGGAIRVGTFGKPVVIDLSGLVIPSQNRSIRFDHDSAHGVGHTDSIEVAGGRLLATGRVSRDTAAAREVVASSKNGFPWQASIGASVDQFEFVREGQAAMVNGRQFEGPVYVVRRATLGEISFVDAAADSNTSATIAAKAKEQDIMTEPQIEQEQTKVQAAAGESAKETITAADPIADMRTKYAAETKRIDAIRKVCAGKFADIEAKAVEEGWDVNKAELEVLRAARPEPPKVGDQGSVPVTSDVLTAAMCLSARLPDVEKAFSGPTLEAAAKSFRRGIGIGELLLLQAELNTGRRFSLRRDSMSDVLRAAFSTTALTGILSNTANKFLLAGYGAGDNSDLEIASTRNVSDFKTVTSYRMTGNGEFQEVAPSGELKHGTLGEEIYTNQAKTYGLMYGIPRTDIINDDLGAFDQLRTRVGMGAAMKRRKVVWTAFLANSAFFTTARGNYKAGADTALSDAALAEAEQLFLDQTDADGNKTGLMPAILLVPTALSATARRFYVAQELRDTTASTKYPTANIWANRFRPVTSTFLGSAAYTGNSAKAWYLLANPAEAATIEVCYLNSVQQPTIEVADADFNVLGIQLRGWFDFGVSLSDFRAGVKLKGEA